MFFFSEKDLEESIFLLNSLYDFYRLKTPDIFEFRNIWRKTYYYFWIKKTKVNWPELKFYFILIDSAVIKQITEAKNKWQLIGSMQDF